MYVAEPSHVAVESWEDSVGESLEKEVQETRKMVSDLQVWKPSRCFFTSTIIKCVFCILSWCRSFSVELLNK